jgi:hypothetical protein
MGAVERAIRERRADGPGLGSVPCRAGFGLGLLLPHFGEGVHDVTLHLLVPDLL